jgi:hypothetical protein
MKRLDQDERRRLCEALLADDPHAQVDLAGLYHEAGMPIFANLVLSLTRSQAKRHARAILSGAGEPRPVGEVLRDARRILNHPRRGGPRP